MNFTSTFFRFFLISLIGLLIDISIFVILLDVINFPFLVSLLSSFTAITFVFITYRFFSLGVFYSGKQFLIWLCYHIISATAYSLCIANLLLIGFAPYIAKLSLAPISFLLNFLVLNKIIKYQLKR